MTEASIASSRRQRAHGALRICARAALARAVLLVAFTLSAGGFVPGRTWVETAHAALLADVNAAAPLISYQGRLVDPATGLPKPDGAYPMAFRLYTATTGGSPLYTEARTVDVVRTVFSVLLGEVTPLDPNIFNGQSLFLGVTVGGDPEMAPRLRLAHAPYALFAERAGVASSAGTANAANTANVANVANTVADNAITSAKIADGSVGAADIGTNAVDGARIADGAVGVADLAPDARPMHFIDVNVYGALLTGSAIFSSGFGPNAGIELPESSLSAAFAVAFTLPPNFPSGGTVTGRLITNINATGCNVYFAPNFISVARVGRGHIIGSTSSTGLNLVSAYWPVPSPANQSAPIDFTVTSPQPGVPLQAYDTISIGFFRLGSNPGDTCSTSLIVQGITLTY